MNLIYGMADSLPQSFQADPACWLPRCLLIEYLAANRQDEIDRMMGWPDPKTLAFHILTFDDRTPRAWSDIETQSRSLSDLVLARRRFRFAKIDGYGFLVERGRLTTFLSDSNAGAIRL